VQIEAMGFPVFARGIIPQGTFKQYAGSVNVPISCAGVTVCPGDIVVGDDDGVTVVPRQSAEQVLRLTRQAAEREREMRRRISNGEVMYDFLKLDELLKRG
jgi:4-hydroxy-4-methyl-2-oxoglutarate aldolase